MPTDSLQAPTVPGGQTGDAPQIAAKPPSRVALLWWGSFAYGDVTVGDYMAVAALGAELKRRGIAFDMIQRAPGGEPVPIITEFSDCERCYDAHEAEGYAACVFICGPMPTDWPEGCAHLLTYVNARRIAAGVTLPSEAGRAPAEETFHEIYARDGFARGWMDMSLACDWPVDAALREGLAVCWRGHEGYYKEVCANVLAEAGVDALLAYRKLEPARLSTDIKSWPTNVRPLDAQFGRFEAVMTTRLHGALLCLRNRTPFVAIDQQIGGGKVSAVARLSGWPYFSVVEEASFTRVAYLLDAALSEGWSERLEVLRAEAIAASQATVRAVANAVEAALASDVRQLADG